MRSLRKLVTAVHDARIARIVLVAMVVLGLSGYAAQAQKSEETSVGPSSHGKATVLIDNDRNAVIQIERGESAASTSGTVNGGIDLAGGLSAVIANLEFLPPYADKVREHDVNAYGQLDTSSTTGILDFKLHMPAGGPPLTAAADIKIKQGNKTAHLEGKVTGHVPNARPDRVPFSKLALDSGFKTDYKTVNGTLNLTLNAATVRQVPVRAVDISVTEPDEKSTTLEASAVVDLSSDVAKNMGIKEPLEKIKAEPKQFEARIKDALSASLSVEAVTITKAEESGNDFTLAISIKASGLRAKLADFVQMAARSTPATGVIDTDVFKQSFANMMALTFSKLSISLKAKDDALTASFTFDGKNFDKFLVGYAALMSNIQEAAFKKRQLKVGRNATADKAFRWWHAVQARVGDINQLLFSDMTGRSAQGSVKLNVEVNDQISFDGAYTQDYTGIDKIVAALKSKGLPVTAGGGVVLHVKADGPQLTGSLYASVNGNLTEVLKALFVDPARQDAELKQTADIVSAMKWQDGRVSFQMSNAKIQCAAYSKTSDLTPLVSSILSLAAPALTGTVQGARFDVRFSDGRLSQTGSVGFKQFMTGKTSDDVKEAAAGALPAAEDVSVNDSANAAQVALVKLETPKVEMPAALASVKRDAETALAEAPLVGGEPPREAARMNLGLLIGIGVALVVLLGIILMSASRKPTT